MIEGTPLYLLSDSDIKPDDPVVLEQLAQEYEDLSAQSFETGYPDKAELEAIVAERCRRKAAEFLIVHHDIAA